MKKLLLLFVLGSAGLFAQPQKLPTPDQFQMLTAAYSAVYHKAMDKCRQGKYKYMVISKMSYEDAKGQKGEYTGLAPEKDGVVINDSLSDSSIEAFGKITVNIEVAAYKEAAPTPVAANVEEYFKMVDGFKP